MTSPKSRLRPAPLAGLKPLRYLGYYRTAAPGVEPDRDDATDATRGGRRETTGVRS